MPTSARQPPGPGQSAERTGPVYIAPGSGRAMRAPTVCAFDDGAFDVDTERSCRKIAAARKDTQKLGGESVKGAALSPFRIPSPARRRQKGPSQNETIKMSEVWSPKGFPNLARCFTLNL